MRKRRVEGKVEREVTHLATFVRMGNVAGVWRVPTHEALALFPKLVIVVNNDENDIREPPHEGREPPMTILL